MRKNPPEESAAQLILRKQLVDLYHRRQNIVVSLKRILIILFNNSSEHKIHMEFRIPLNSTTALYAGKVHLLNIFRTGALHQLSACVPD